MKINKAYRTEIDPNDVQTTLLRKHAGAARAAWNWALNRRIEEYKLTGKSSNAIEQHRQLNSLKPTDFPWMYEISKCAPQEALRDLDKAFRNFFAKRAKLGTTKVSNGPEQSVQVVSQAPQGSIAGLTEQATNLAGFVVMVHGQDFRRSLAERALAVLQLPHLLKLFDGKAILLAKHTGPVTALSLFDRERLSIGSDLSLDGFPMLVIRGVLFASLGGRAFALAANLVMVSLFPVLLGGVVTTSAPMLKSVGGRGTCLKLGSGLGLSAALAGFGVHALIILACQPHSKRLGEKNEVRHQTRLPRWNVHPRKWPRRALSLQSREDGWRLCDVLGVGVARREVLPACRLSDDLSSECPAVNQGWSVLPVHQNLFGLRHGQGRNAAVRADLLLRQLWPSHRPGRERSKEPFESE